MHRLVIALALGVVHAISAAAQTAGGALVVGIGASGSCASVAHAVADRFAAQGLAVRTLTNPTSIGFRRGLNEFAAGLEDTAPTMALIYVCSPAVQLGTRLFAVPSGVDPADAPVQAIVMPALLNALAGSGGTVVVDLNPMSPMTEADQAVMRQALAERLPAGLHLALNLASKDAEAALGRRLAAGMARLDAPWDVAGPALASALPAGQVELLPPIPATSPSDPTQQPVAAATAAAPGDLVPSNVAPATVTAGADATAADPPPAAPRSPPRAPLLTRVPPVQERRPPAQPATSREPATRTPTQEDRIARLQRALLRHGVYPGPITGRLDTATAWAIRLFQRRLQHPDTGVLTQSEIVRLLND